MKNSSTQRGFNFSTGTLVRDAERLLGALQEATVGTPIVEFMAATTVADLTNQIALVAKLVSDHSTAKGAVSTLTQSQRKALADFVRLASALRRAARFTFANQDTVLRSEFQVGVKQPRGLPAMLERGRILLAAGQTYVTELAPQGWTAANNTLLAEALETLTGTDRIQEAAKDDKLATAGQRRAAAKRLYQQCVAIQNAARVLYPNTSADPNTVSLRARFLLGEFPPRSKAKPVVTPGPTAPVPPLTPVAKAA